MARELSVEPADTDLPDLTPQQRAFVEALAQGQTASDAYRQAYPISQTWDQTAVWSKASEVKRNGKVAVWLRALRNEQLTAAKYTLDEHIRELGDLGDEARAAGAYGAATQCTIRKGMAVGHYIDRTLDLTPARNTDQQIIATLQRIFGEEAAQDAARRLGYIQGEIDAQ